MDFFEKTILAEFLGEGQTHVPLNQLIKEFKHAGGHCFAMP